MDSQLDEMHRRESSKHVQPAIFGGPVLRMCSPGVQCSSDPMFLGSNISQVLCSPMHHMGSPRFICLQGLMFPGSTYRVICSRVPSKQSTLGFRTGEHRTLGQLIGRTGEYRTLERIYVELMFVCFHLALSRFICPSQQSPDNRDGYRSAQITSLHFNETVCAVRLFKPEHAVQPTRERKAVVKEMDGGAAVN